MHLPENDKKILKWLFKHPKHKANAKLELKLGPGGRNVWYCFQDYHAFTKDWPESFRNEMFSLMYEL